MNRLLRTLAELLAMIKFQHSLFALPFAFTGMIAAAGGLPDARTFWLITACMVFARTAAMTFNRIADRRFDAANPRTRDRALPAGRIRTSSAVALLLASALLFVLAAAALNPLTAMLSPVALVIVLGYSLAKRFTWATHLLLGLALALAPIGAWVAVRGRLDPEVLLLGLGVLAWTAGFDILHACQDADFDRAQGLHSIPARFGVAKALEIARLFHVLAALSLLAFAPAAGLGVAWLVAIGLATGVMAWSHALVSPGDLSRVGLAFFQANVTVALLALLGIVLEQFGRP